jgi:hypothetical protein
MVSSTSLVALQDNGVTGAIDLFPGATCGLQPSTMYIVYFNFSFGDIEPFSFFFVKTASTVTTATKIYSTGTGAQNSDLGEALGGTFGGYGNVTQNALMYFSSSYSAPPNIQKEMAKVEIEQLEHRAQILQEITAVDDPEAELERLLNRISELTNKTKSQVEANEGRNGLTRPDATKKKD